MGRLVMLLALAVGWFSEDRVPHNHPEISHGGYMAGYSGTCFCGSVQLTVEGQPEVMGYCHCNSCRKWSAAPVNAFSLWQRDAVKITRGAERIATFNLTPGSYRKWCMTCGGHLYTEHPGIGLVDIYAATIPDMPVANILRLEGMGCVTSFGQRTYGLPHSATAALVAL